ncbi:uncharacterized membrane protein YcjF (UPF0283 family) [Paenibacillus anaericanus]|uniref:hypothetical protein n=1 Tax=Paenibacillus anaericanus TaxID=170367 RepID=UPI002785EA07|nr:hypothetical protein [Paenibacillus anaericanus]MDQ0088863.1 uncharacterized membrane protein YcjF (UPF0283 family) [Paenibacillus anaericanus]
MIWFILFIASALSIFIAAMVQKKRSAREIVLFVLIVLLGFAVWISIFLDQKFNLNQWIAILITWIGI